MKCVDSDYVPLSVVIVVGTPNLLTQPVMNHCVTDCTVVCKWNYFRPIGESENPGEEIRSLTKRKWTSVINMNMVKSSIKNEKKCRS